MLAEGLPPGNVVTAGVKVTAGDGDRSGDCAGDADGGGVELPVTVAVGDSDGDCAAVGKPVECGVRLSEPGDEKLPVGEEGTSRWCCNTATGTVKPDVARKNSSKSATAAAAQAQLASCLVPATSLASRSERLVEQACDNFLLPFQANHAEFNSRKLLTAVLNKFGNSSRCNCPQESKQTAMAA